MESVHYGRDGRVMYKFINPNPAGQMVGDCVIRALSIATKMDWETVYMRVCLQGYLMNDMPSSNAVWGAYLRTLGYRRYAIPNECPDCYKISDFCDDNPEGTFIVATGNHVVTVINGDYYDAWDSGNEVPIYYWVKEE